MGGRGSGPKKRPVRVVETGQIFESLSACVRDGPGRSIASIQYCIDNGTVQRLTGLHYEYVDDEE